MKTVLTDIPIYRAATDSKHIRGRYLPCLSYLSFKLLPDDTVALTAMYRYHYYVQRALGNLFGLAQLQAFVAAEVGARVGPLVCHSTSATIDTDSRSIKEVGTLRAILAVPIPATQIHERSSSSQRSRHIHGYVCHRTPLFQVLAYRFNSILNRGLRIELPKQRSVWDQASQPADMAD